MNQNHVIKKQTLDISLDSEVGSFAVQGRLSTICHDLIAPAMDRYLTAVGDMSHIHRIERLEVDLGEIRPECLEKDFSRKIDEIFPRVLSQKIRNLQECSHGDIAGSWNEGRWGGNPGDSFVDRKDRGYELLRYLLEKGRLPWWADKSDFAELSRFLKAQVKANPQGMKKLFTEALTGETMTRRLVYQFDDSALDVIVKTVQERHHKSICLMRRDISECMADLHLFRDISIGKLRSELWIYVFRLCRVKTTFRQQEIVQGAAGYFAGRFRVDGEKVLAHLVRHLNGRGYTLTYKSATDEKTGGRFEKGTHGKVNDEGKRSDADRNVKMISSSLKTLAGELTAVGNLPAVNRHRDIREMLSSFLDLQRNGSFSRDIPSAFFEASTVEALKELISILENFLSSLNVESDRETVTRAIKSGGALMERIEKNRQDGDSPAGVRNLEPAQVNSFTDTEEVFVGNSGIVLFWPYLKKLFETTGVMNENVFVDEEKRVRALFMLQYLADETRNAPEHELVLNKILCGMDPEEPVDSSVTLTEPEMAECNALLGAVIANWGAGSAMKPLSPRGVRSMFLIRDGLIRARDADLVLRVEEKAHDILLDKLPWGISTVKLPWMESPLFVEWR